MAIAYAARHPAKVSHLILHGAYAYLAVTRFWRTEARHSGDRLAAFEFARWRAAHPACSRSSHLHTLPVPNADRTGP